MNYRVFELSKYSRTKAPIITPNMTSGSIDGYTTSYPPYFNTLQNSNRYYSRQAGFLYFPKAFTVTHIKVGGYDNAWYYARGTYMDYYLGSTLVLRTTINPVALANTTTTLSTPVYCDRVYNSYGWGSSWSGNGGQAQPGKQFIGYIFK